MGVDILKQHGLMVDPANSRLVDRQGQFFATVAHPIPPRASVVTGFHQQYSSPGLAASPPAASPSSTPPSASLLSTSSPSPSPCLASSTASSYRAILDEFPEVVNLSKRLLEVSHKVVHHIVTTGPPIVAKFCRLDGEKLEAVKVEFQQLEAYGIIQRSTSPWASPLHMVQKKDGSWHLCSVFRRLNVVTEPDVYLLPNMLDFVAKAQFSLRLTSGKVITKSRSTQ